MTRVQRLTGRVSWLDRHRRLVAIAGAALLAPLMIAELGDVLGADWPQLHATALSVMVGFALWCVLEVGLVWLTAVWETECYRLVRDGALPRAVIHRQD